LLRLFDSWIGELRVIVFDAQSQAFPQQALVLTCAVCDHCFSGSSRYYSKVQKKESMAKLIADQRDEKVVGLQEQLEARRRGLPEVNFDTHCV
jgi:hypothetical protein